MKTSLKVFLFIGLTVAIGLSAFVYYRYYFVFGEGVKAGQLNYLVKKGYVFKTYEGKLIQSGIKSGMPGSVSSNEFIFSVSDERVAKKLMENSGKSFELYYKEYPNTLPWRGYSVFVVDSVLSMQ